MEHDERADELEREADDLEHRSGQVEQQIRDTREDWDSKVSAGDVPGALDEKAAAQGGTEDSEDEDEDEDDAGDED